MLSRIFWVGIAGIALVAGMALQDGGWLFDSVERELGVEQAIDRSVDRTVDRAVDGSVHRLQVVGSDGRQVDVSPETKRALAEAVGGLVKAEADLAVLRVRGGGDSPELQAANARRAHARAEVDRLKAEVKAQEQLASVERDALRDQIRREVRDEIREATRN
jgi:hypothetical protein